MAEGEDKYIDRAVLETVENQLREGTPPETRATLERLMKEGYSREEAVRLIGRVVTAEIFGVLKEGEPSDENRYVAALRRLPALPGE